jgi:hypothetical protein
VLRMVCHAVHSFIYMGANSAQYRVVMSINIVMHECVHLCLDVKFIQEIRGKYFDKMVQSFHVVVA